MSEDRTLLLFQTLISAKTRGPISRKKLADRLGLGEGVMRRLLDGLTESGLVQRKKRGVVLSDKGQVLMAGTEIREIVIDLQGLAVDIFNAAVMLDPGKLDVNASSLRFGLEQRDSAVMAGASGATTLVFNDSRLMIPSHPEHTPVKPGITKYFKGLFQLEDGCILLIGSGPSYEIGEKGALAAALTFLPELEKSIA